jgi:hypothetical protein
MAKDHLLAASGADRTANITTAMERLQAVSLILSHGRGTAN